MHARSIPGVASFYYGVRRGTDDTTNDSSEACRIPGAVFCLSDSDILSVDQHV